MAGSFSVVLRQSGARVISRYLRPRQAENGALPQLGLSLFVLCFYEEENENTLK